MTPEKRIKEEIRKVCARMETDLRGYRVVLFGSRTAGTARDRSDFDVGDKHMHTKPVFVRAEWDEEAGVWVATSEEMHFLLKT